MSWIVSDIFKAAIGLLVNKGRDMAAQKLKDGDVTDQKIHDFIVRDMDDITSKMDGSSRKDLLASISFFKEGIMFLNEVFTRTRHGAVTTRAAYVGEWKSLAEKIKNLEPTALNESAVRSLSNAKKRFEAARKEATRAFNNEALKTSDRILAMQYRVMATILETVDNIADALVPCQVCAEELNDLSQVKHNFQVELNEGKENWIYRDERLKIISNVCHVNRVIYDVACMINRFDNSNVRIFAHCPSVLICDCQNNETKVYLLFDSRVAKAVSDNMEHVCVPWSFGQAGEEQQNIMKPQVGLATNSHGQFVIADYGNRNVKVFDNSGNYQFAFYPTSGDGTPDLNVYDVANDLEDMIYVLAGKTQGLGHMKYGVHVFTNTAELYRKFSLQKGDWNRVLVNDNRKVMVIGTVGGNEVIDVYESSQHVWRFGEGILKVVCDATAVKDGNVMVVDTFDSCIHLFSEWGDHLKQFQLRGLYNHVSIAYHLASEVVVVSGVDRGRQDGSLQFFAYTGYGEFVSSLELYREEFMPYTKTAMDIDHLGRIALGFQDDTGKGKMLVV